jgi:hypothetical protein
MRASGGADGPLDSLKPIFERRHGDGDRMTWRGPMDLGDTIGLPIIYGIAWIAAGVWVWNYKFEEFSHIAWFPEAWTAYLIISAIALVIGVLVGIAALLGLAVRVFRRCAGLRAK